MKIERVARFVLRLVRAAEADQIRRDDARSKAGVRRFPELVPERTDDPGAAISRKARDWLSSSWKGESFMAIGMKDPVLGEPVMRALHGSIRNCREPYLVAQGGHFLQEWGEEVTRWFLSKT